MIYAIIQARLSSTRLPGKVLMDLAGKSVLWHIVNRVKHSKKIGEIIVATTTDASDDRIFSYCLREKIECFRGNLEDVLDRYYKAAIRYNIKHSDIVVRITGDCPLIEPTVVDEVIDLYENSGVDYASNTNPPTYPDGLDVEVFSFYALEKAWREAKLNSEREHVTPYIRNNTNIFTHANLRNSQDLSNYRWTLDEKEDYALVQAIYNKLYNKDAIFNMQEVLRFLEENKNINNLNSKFKRNEGYEKSLLMDK